MPIVVLNMPKPILQAHISMFKWIADFNIKPVPLLKEVQYDFFNDLKENKNTIPGPFNKLSKATTIVLTEKPVIKDTLLVSIRIRKANSRTYCISF